MDGDDVEIKDFEYRKSDVVEIMKNKASWYLHRYGIIQGLSMSGWVNFFLLCKWIFSIDFFVFPVIVSPRYWVESREFIICTCLLAS